MKIDKIISEFKALKLETKPTHKVKELLRQVGNIGYMSVTLHKGKSIMRARPNKGDEKFTCKADYSFKPQKYNKNFQRASTPNQTMFYGSFLPDNIESGELDNARLIGVLETMPWLRDELTSGYQKISFGRWYVEEDINLIAIIHNDDFYAESNYTRELINDYNYFINQTNSKTLENSLKFQKFMAYEFSKEISNHTDYLISAIFTEILTKHLNIDGVIYPSVRTFGQGFNVAIKPKSCKKLGLYVAGECSIYKLKDKSIIGNESIVQLDGKTEKFELEEIPDHRVKCLQKLGINSIDELK